jgi:hypothetical protein
MFNHDMLAEFMAPNDRERYTPGVNDGGKRKRCFQRLTRSGVDWTEQTPANTRLVSDVRDVLLFRAKHKLTQAASGEMIRFAYKHGYPVPAEARPLNWRHMLTFLEDQGALSNCECIMYDYCTTCGELYRGENHASPSCLNPECGCERDQNTKAWVYRCVIYWGILARLRAANVFNSMYGHPFFEEVDCASTSRAWSPACVGPPTGPLATM